MTVERKYQVFVSSTYTDLLVERQEIMQALLELDCIPAGMELFPASNEDQWSLIKGVIDDCDYYVVVIGGRYGSVGEEGLSYTEMEYRYAIEVGKPVIAFLHKDPDQISKKFSEQTKEGQQKLNDFRKLVQKKMCRFWSSPQELGSIVSRSLISLQKKFPSVGWVRGDMISSKDASLEILSLKKEIESLQKKLIEARTKAPEGSEKFAQGSDFTFLNYRVKFGATRYEAETYGEKCKITWDDIFYWVSPLMIDEVADIKMKEALDKLIIQRSNDFLHKSKEYKNGNFMRSTSIMMIFRRSKYN